MQSLPTHHRQLLTSLVASLSQLPPPNDDANDGDDDDDANDGDNDDADDDAGRPADRRRLLLTLHVVFPSIVLPALDLLDRGLVTRITAAAAAAATEPDDPRAIGGHSSHGHDGAGAGRPTSSPPARQQPAPARVYAVRSLAFTLTRRGPRQPASASRIYIVHLDAWSCSCASFALEAFAGHAPPTAPAGDAPAAPAMSPSSAVLGQHDPAKPSLLFGGMSMDGLSGHGDQVPCCKHLLACLLVEAWGDIPACHVDDRRATREELAGIVASL